MSFSEHPRVLVQGITGQEASFWTERMIACGTEVVAGVTPGKGGRTVHGVPVYGSVGEIPPERAPDTSLLFVPPRAAKAAALEAVEHGIQRIAILVEHIPIHDVMQIHAEAHERGVTVLGPNSPGLVFPERSFLGILPAWEPRIFKRGSVGVVSRSGSLGTLACVNLVRAGLGQSAFFGIGGDPMVGMRFIDALRWFEGDENTHAVALIGEIGGTMEEDAAPFIAEMTKPVVAFIAGSSAPPGRRMGHAGAIVAGGRGTAASKRSALEASGARLADVPSQVSEIVRTLVGTD